jgi:RNA methyltransferase, TrmH family
MTAATMKFEDIRKLHQKKYREEFGCFLVEGEHPVLELQKAATVHPSLQQCELYVTEGREAWRSPFVTHVVSEAQMARLSDTRTPQGIVAVVPMLHPVPSRPGERVIYLHEIQDPGNLGTILRTMAWFGSLRCLLGPGSVDPYNSKVVRASMGAIFHVPFEVEVPLEALRARFGRIACLDVRGEPVASSAFRAFDCYLFGNEARGLPADQVAALHPVSFTIPGTGTIESLNLASSVNIALYELTRQQPNTFSR